MNKTRITSRTKANATLLALVFFSIFGCAQEKPVSEPVEIVRPVKTRVIKHSPESLGVKEFSGIAQSDDSATLSFRVAGVLKEMTVEVGDQVKKGELVASLDERDFLLSVKDFESQLTTAQAELDQIQKGARTEDIRILENNIASMESSVKTARQEYQRVQQLYVNDAASKGRLDEAKNSLDKALLDRNSATEEYVIATHGGREEEVRAKTFKVESIASNLEQAQVNLSYTKIQAPFDGEIAEKHVFNFERVPAGQKIYTLVDLKHIEIQISVPEEWISNVRKGQPVKVKFSKYPGKVIKGSVDRIGVIADSTTLTYPVIIKIANTKREFLPGMSSTVTLQLSGLNKNIVTIPIHSITEDIATGDSFAWIVDKQTSAVKKTPLKVGKIIGDEIAIKKGLKSGDRVVTAGADRLREGLVVRVTQTP